VRTYAHSSTSADCYADTNAFGNANLDPRAHCYTYGYANYDAG
jgi:hypothetical protein